MGVGLGTELGGVAVGAQDAAECTRHGESACIVVVRAGKELVSLGVSVES